MGFPTIVSRTGFAPVMKDKARVRNPETEVGATLMNAILWQLAGVNGLVPRAMMICDVSGGVISTRRRWISWDADNALPANEILFAYVGVGNYTFAFGHSTYSDEAGNQVAIALDFVSAIPMIAVAASPRIIGNGAMNADNKSGSIYFRDTVAAAAADPARFLALFY